MPNSRKIGFIRKFYNRSDYNNFIDNTFNELNLPEPPSSVANNIYTDPQKQINNFFNIYDKIFYLIPELGNTNSHEYLVRTSGNLLNFDETDDSINLLQSEIASLREDFLESQQLVLQLQTENSELKATLNIPNENSI
jgi:hypothetical protein